MTPGVGSFSITDPLSAQDVIHELGEHLGAEVAVKIAGTSVEVYAVSYDPNREQYVLHLHPDDLDDALRRLFRQRTPPVDQVAERATGEGSTR